MEVSFSHLFLIIPSFSHEGPAPLKQGTTVIFVHLASPSRRASLSSGMGLGIFKFLHFIFTMSGVPRLLLSCDLGRH